MARQTATYLYCDGPNCKEFAQVADAGEALDGWYKCYSGKNGKYDSQNSWEFHSLRCVEKWAKGRRDALNSHYKRSSGRTAEEMDLHEKQKNAIMETFEEMGSDTVLSVTELAELTGIERSSVNRRVNELREDRTIFAAEGVPVLQDIG